MKKTYIIPNTVIVHLSPRTGLLEASVQVFNTETDTDSWVKEDNSRSTSSNYNVWKDDWRQ